jgi:hypothetical protein
MKKRQWLVLAAVLAASVVLSAQSITVTAPAAGNNWCLGSSHVIAWTKSGAMQPTVAIRLRRVGSPESADAALQIANGESNDGSYSWTVPNTLAAGDYFIRVRTDDSTVIGDSAAFRISSCLQVSQPTMNISTNPMRRLTLAVNFHTDMKYAERLRGAGQRQLHVQTIDSAPNEFLVGHYYRCLSLNTSEEYVAQQFSGSPLWDAAQIRRLAGKTIVKATLSFRHRKTESNPVVATPCLDKVLFYAGRMGEDNPPPYETRILAVSIWLAPEIDVTVMMVNWLHEEEPGYHGEKHNFRMKFTGSAPRRLCTNSVCLSWYDSGSLEIQYRD